MKGGIFVFGYVKADTPELRVRENEYYRALYCGLCKAQGKCTGLCSRFSLSYDMTFLCAVRMAITKTQPIFKRGICIAHPLKKRNYAALNDELAYCAYATSILAYGKCIDDIHDEKGKKKLVALCAKLFMKSGRRRAVSKKSSKYSLMKYEKAKLYELDAYITSKLYELSNLEKQNLNSVDAYAELFGDILEEIASFGLEGNEEKIMRRIGRHVGRWVYITDAADDIKDDAEKSRFNPFINIYDGKYPTKEEREGILVALNAELGDAEIAFDLIDYGDMRDLHELINNIIYLGMPKNAKKALRLDEESACRDNKKSKKKSVKNKRNKGEAL